MNCLLLLASFLACIWLSWHMTGGFVTYALEKRLVDVPNGRSSHSRVTPRGGGISFVVTFLTAASLLGMPHGLPIGLPFRSLGALMVGGVAALLGYLDDIYCLSVKVRILVQFAVTTAALVLIGGNPFVAFHYSAVVIVAISVIGIIAYTWLINLVNFMDGIDGLAGSEAVCVSGSCCVLILMRHGSDDIGVLFGILACAALGFLFLNWPAAHIFMGDAGSYFLGFTIGALTLLGVVRHVLGMWVGPILMGVFIVDATSTVLHRMLRGERWWKPHRLFGFHHAADVFGHRNVTLSVIAIDLLWLLPMAVLADVYPRIGLALLCAAWAPVILLSYLFHSGEVLTPGAMPRWRTFVLITRCPSERTMHRLVIHARKVAATRVSLIRALLIACLAVISTALAIAAHIWMMASGLPAGVIACLGVFCSAQVATLLTFKMHRYHLHLISLEELPNITGICVVATLVGLIGTVIVAPASASVLPPSFYAIQAAILVALVVFIRMSAASLSRTQPSGGREAPAKRVVIYGANNAGLEILSNLRRLGPEYRVVGFVDPRTSMKGIPIAGGRVLGADSEISKIVLTYNVDDVLMSASTASSPTGGKFLERCRDAAVEVRIVPSIERGFEAVRGAEPMRASSVS